MQSKNIEKFKTEEKEAIKHDKRYCKEKKRQTENRWKYALKKENVRRIHSLQMTILFDIDEILDYNSNNVRKYNKSKINQNKNILNQVSKL